jgi:hypothetical protein
MAGRGLCAAASAKARVIPVSREEPRFMIEQWLEGNLNVVATEYRPNAEYYQTIAAKQTPKVLWLGCSDSRVSEHQMTDSKPRYDVRALQRGGKRMTSAARTTKGLVTWAG